MKLHCNRCRRDFTTLIDADRQKMVRYLDFSKWRCPYCGVHNTRTKARGGWYRGGDTDEIQQPIVASRECQARIRGGIDSGFSVVCDGCPSAFQCLTGNVDDGIEQSEDYNPAVIKIDLNEMEKVNKRAELDKLLKELKHNNITLYYKEGYYRIKVGSTIYKVKDLNELTLTPQASVFIPKIREAYKCATAKHVKEN
jgi:hypothetical protein